MFSTRDQSLYFLDYFLYSSENRLVCLQHYSLVIVLKINDKAVLDSLGMHDIRHNFVSVHTFNTSLSNETSSLKYKYMELGT